MIVNWKANPKFNGADFVFITNTASIQTYDLKPSHRLKFRQVTPAQSESNAIQVYQPRPNFALEFRQVAPAQAESNVIQTYQPQPNFALEFRQLTPVDIVEIIDEKVYPVGSRLYEQGLREDEEIMAIIMAFMEIKR